MLLPIKFPSTLLITYSSLPSYISPHMIHYDRLRDAAVLCPLQSKTLFCFIYTPTG